MIYTLEYIGAWPYDFSSSLNTGQFSIDTTTAVKTNFKYFFVQIIFNILVYYKLHFDIYTTA